MTDLVTAQHQHVLRAEAMLGDELPPPAGLNVPGFSEPLCGISELDAVFMHAGNKPVAQNRFGSQDRCRDQGSRIGNFRNLASRPGFPQ
jgi:hypothetical protein